MTFSRPDVAGRGLMACAGLVVGALTTFATARADTITQTLDFALNSTSSATDLAFSRFDPTLGTLDAVQLGFTAVRRQDWGLWNTSGTFRNVDYAATLSGTTLSLAGQTAGFANLSYGPGAAALGPVSFATAASDFLTGRTQFLAGGTPTFASAFQPPESDTLIQGLLSLPSSGGTLGTWASTGTVALSYSPGTWQLDASNVFSGSLVDVRGTATLTYTYRRATVADSRLPVGVLAVVLVGLIAVGRRRGA